MPKNSWVILAKLVERLWQGDNRCTCILAVILQNYIRFPGETVQQDEVFIAEYKRCWAPCTIEARDFIVGPKTKIRRLEQIEFNNIINNKTE